MLDIGVTKIAIIGAIALVVIGPERLPGVARTLGTLLGRARSYMADVKAEVDRSMALDELKKIQKPREYLRYLSPVRMLYSILRKYKIFLITNIKDYKKLFK